MNIKLKKGDIFCSTNPMALGRIINAIQRIWSSDNKSIYSHSGIIIEPDGTTLEALWTVRSENIFKKYAGDNVIIGRHESMTEAIFELGMKGIKNHIGDFYPFWKLPLFMLPPLAKINLSGRHVCSVLASKFLYACHLVDYYKGKNPDHVADMIEREKGWKIVFKGKIE